MKGRLLLAVLGLVLSLGPAQANYWEGHEAFRRGDYGTAQREFQRLAQLGHAAAQFNLGYLYQHGLAVPRDPAEAAKWYRESAGQGRVEAQFSLGTLYETGAGVRRDAVLAYRWYNLAASNAAPGLSRDRLVRHRERIAKQLSADQRQAVAAAPAPAGFALGADLAAGGEAQAAHWSVADLQRKLAERSFNPGAIDGEMGRSTVGALAAFQASVGLDVTGEADPPSLAKLFGPEEVAPYLEPFPRPTPARKEPVPPAVPVPPVEAVHLDAPAKAAAASEIAAAPAEAAPEDILEDAPPPPVPVAATAAAASDHDAQDKPAEDDAAEDMAAEDKADRDNGGGLRETDALRRLAEQGDAGAQISLATRYHYGQGFEEDHAEAVKWYLRAARQGRVDALFPLGSIYELRASGPRDLLEAHRWYSLAADLVPAGKAREIIVGRRDRVAKRLTPELLAEAQAATWKMGETPAETSETPAETAAETATQARNRATTGAPIQTVAGAKESATAPAPLPDRPANWPPRALVFAPPGETARDTVVLAENAAGGTVLGAFRAVDPDAEDALAYRLREDADGRFAVDAASGTLTVAEGASLDFETASDHEIVVRVTDSGGLFHERSLTVELADRNEAPEAEAVALTVAETAAAGAALGRIRAVDPDGGDNGALRYRLDDDGPFAVDPATGDIFLAEGAGLDYETTPRFDLAVTVTDGGGLSARVPVSVAVEDRNEKPTLAAGEFALDETAGAGAAVGRVQGDDPDAGINGALRYTIAEGPGSADFVIDAESGEITVADGARLDFETQPAIELSVAVADGGGLQSDAPIRVALRDANEPPAALKMTGGAVAERAEPGTVVAELVARDPDAGERLTFSLVDDAGGRFAIDAASGTITVGDGADLDFDAASEHRIRVRVTDSGGLDVEEILSLAVTDENFAPTWAARAEASVAENAEGGALVAEIAASDPDAGERLTYSLSEDAGGRFAIDAESGRITVRDGTDLDFESEPSHQLRVRVVDSGGLAYEEALAVAVRDVNEAPRLAAASFVVDERATGGATVGRLRAGDPDGGDNGRLSYAISGDDLGGQFVVDSASGVLRVADGADLDFESRPRHELEVTATDGGGLSHRARVTIDLVDRNDPPHGVRLIGGAVPESAGSGRYAGQIVAFDPDAGDSVIFQLTDDAEGRFAVDSRSGTLRVAGDGRLDFERAASHRLALRVTDSGGLSRDAILLMAVTDVNEPPSAAETSFKVSENAAAGALVGRVEAADPDRDDRLSYALDDDADGRFAIDEATGALTVAEGARLDFEAQPSLRVIARITDRRGMSDAVVVPIAVADVNETPSGSVTIDGMVAETAAPGTVAAAYTATDPDAGDRLSYRLSDDAGGRFLIDRRNGLVTVADGAAFDFAAAPRHQITVRVTDSRGLAFEAPVTIAVIDVEDAPAGQTAPRLAQEAAVLDLASKGDLANGGDHNGGGRNGDGGNGKGHNGNGHGRALAGLGDAGIGTARMGTWVESMQGYLVEAGFDPGPVDGKLGPRTRAALSEYQQAYRLTELKEAELLDHMKVRAHFRRGYELQVRGKFRDSIGQYSEVLRLDPEHFSAYFNRGLIYYAEHRDDRAIEDFGQAIGLRPDYAGAYVNRGNAYYRQGAYASAARDYLKAIGIWVTPW